MKVIKLLTEVTPFKLTLFEKVLTSVNELVPVNELLDVNVLAPVNVLLDVNVLAAFK